MEKSTIWKTEPGKTLLRQAYPEGYLLRRGVLTIEGWQCRQRGAGKDTNLGFDSAGCTHGRNRSDFGTMGLLSTCLSAPIAQSVIEREELLPDPTDPATWALLMLDLYEEQDKIDDQRSALIEDIERQLRTTHQIRRLFTVRWTIR